MATCIKDANWNLNRLTFAYNKVEAEDIMLSGQEGKAMEQAKKRAEDAAKAVQKLQETAEARKELTRVQLAGIGKRVAGLQKECNAAAEALVHSSPRRRRWGSSRQMHWGKYPQDP